MKTAAGDPTHTLTYEERAFLAGSLFIKLLRRRAAPSGVTVGAWSFLRARAALASESDMTIGQVAGLVGARPEILLGFLGRFEGGVDSPSRRLRIGRAVIGHSTGLALVGAAGTTAIVALRMAVPRMMRGPVGRVLWRLRGRPSPLVRLESWDEIDARPGRDRRPTPERRRSRSPLDMLESWDDIPPAADALQDWRDADEPAPAPSRADVAGKKAVRATARRSELSDWLTPLGLDQTGVRIEPYIASIAASVPAPALVEIAGIRHAEGDLPALQRLAEVVSEQRPNANASLHLRRLVAAVRLGEHGYTLPPRAASPAYEPDPGRIFYLLHMRDPYEVNGYVTRSRLVIAAMVAAGLRPVALTRLGFPNDLARHRHAVIADEDILNGVPVLALGDSAHGLLGRPLDDYIDAYADRIVELARRYRPSAIQAASNYMNGLAALRAARILGIPCVYEVRGIWEITQLSENTDYGLTLRYAMQRRLENQIVADADGVVTISEQLRRFVIEHGADRDRVTVVPNGVEAEKIQHMPRDPVLEARLGIAPETAVIGYVGSVVYYEGLDYLLRAIDLLRRRGAPDFRFLLIGDGKALPAIRDLAEKLGVADICIFLGRVPHDEVEGLFSMIDIAPLPRRSLPVTELVPPLKPFEAMAAGKAVVVSSVAAMAETVVDGETGLIFEKDNVAALADALERLMRDPALRARLSDAGRRRVEGAHSVAGIGEILRGVYRSLHGGPGCG